MMKFKSIASRIIVSAIPVMAISTIVFISVIYMVTYRQNTAQINDKMIEMVEVASQNIQLELIKNSNISSSMAIYAANASVDTLTSPEFPEFVRRSIDSNENTVGGGIWFEPYVLDESAKYFSSYAYLDNGMTVVTMNYSDHVDYHGEIWYLDGKRSKGEVIWSDIYFDPVANVTMVTATQPFYDALGKMLGVTTADMALTDIRKIVKQIKLGETGDAFIIGNHGEYIAYLDESRDISDRIQDDEDKALAVLGREVMSNDSGVTKIVLNGIERNVYYDTLPLGWKLLIGIHTAEIRSSTVDLVLLMGIVPIIGLILAVICILWVARHIKKVVSRVNYFADMAASGDFSKRIEIIENDEFGVMEDRLNKMISNMNDMRTRTEDMLHIAQAASKSKSDFLSRMSHEIRTPMNAIIGMTEIAMDSEDIAQIKGYLGKTQNASGHLLSLINDILDMAKIEANKLELYKKEFDLHKKMKSVFELMGVGAADRKLDFTMNIAPNVPRYIISDELRLAQIFHNLLSNAIKFTPENGSVKVSVEAKHDVKKENYVYIIIHVEDSGIGISEEGKVRLFESFEQADSGIAKKYGGTGLGLPISRALAEMMGGEMWVESELSKGSVFSFSIFAEEGEGKNNMDEVKELDVISDLSNKTILLAEDIAVNREIVKAMLAKTHVKIEYAENGLEAVEKFGNGNGKYGLILMDMQMPEMDGLEATAKIREMDLGKNVPILAITANAFQSDIDKALAAGMNGHIAKPIDSKLLVRKVSEYLTK